MRIEVKALVGKNALTPEDGKAVHALVRPEIAANNPVELDFAGVEVFASPFFNWGIARLMAEFTPGILNELLKFVNLAPAGEHALRRSIANAKEYYAASAAERRAIDETVSHGAMAL